MIPTTRFFFRLTRATFPLCAAALLLPTVATVLAQEKGTRPFAIEETAERVTLRGSALEASIKKNCYVCFIHEVGERPVKAGESFGAAYIVGWFDSIEEMEQVYDQYRGHSALEVMAEGWKLIPSSAPAGARAVTLEKADASAKAREEMKRNAGRNSL